MVRDIVAGTCGGWGQTLAGESRHPFFWGTFLPRFCGLSIAGHSFAHIWIAHFLVLCLAFVEHARSLLQWVRTRQMRTSVLRFAPHTPSPRNSHFLTHTNTPVVMWLWFFCAVSVIECGSVPGILPRAPSLRACCACFSKRHPSFCSIFVCVFRPAS